MDTYEVLGLVPEIVAKHYCVRSPLKQLEEYHKHTYLHSVHVAFIASQIAAEFGLSSHRIESVAMGALLHDIGKLDVPLSILNKEGPLTDEELQFIQQHPLRSYERAGEAGVPMLPRLICLMHHYCINGEGYPIHFPEGVDSSRVPTEARIVTVADMYAAIVSPRPYKDSLEDIYALGELYKDVYNGRLDIRFVRSLDSLFRSRKLLININAYMGPELP